MCWSLSWACSAAVSHVAVTTLHTWKRMKPRGSKKPVLSFLLIGMHELSDWETVPWVWQSAFWHLTSWLTVTSVLIPFLRQKRNYMKHPITAQAGDKTAHKSQKSNLDLYLHLMCCSSFCLNCSSSSILCDPEASYRQGLLSDHHEDCACTAVLEKWNTRSNSYPEKYLHRCNE